MALSPCRRRRLRSTAWGPILRNSHSLALNYGTVVARGWGATEPAAGLNGVVAIAAGRYHSLVLKADGTVVAWGANGFAVPLGLNDVVAVAAGYNNSLALKADGTVVAWGENYSGQSTVPGLNAIAIAAGDQHSLAVKPDGTVGAWGQNIFGESTVPGLLTGVIAVAAGQYHSLAPQSRRHSRGLGQTFTAKARTERIEWRCRHRRKTRSQSGAQTDGTVVVGRELLRLEHGAGQLEWRCRHRLSSLSQSRPQIRRHGRRLGNTNRAPRGLNGVVAIAAGQFHSLASN
jgi:hypothetical protein